MSGIFDTLPSVSFAPLDPAEIEKDILGRYETITGATLYPGDPVRLFLESVAMDMTILCRLIDMAGKQNLLAFASGSHLDHLGALMATSRLPAAPARCVLRFELAEALDFAVLIPQGTRAGTQDRRISFATDAAASISAGELFVDATATADTPGADGNGLLAGQVSLLIDPIAYVTRVTNTAMTMGGAEVEADARYRERIHLAPESFTCAGPEQAYRYHALRVNPDIAEVAVWSPKPGHVDVRPVLNGGELPDAATLEAVRAALSAEDVRPLTDTVTVAAPEPVPYRIAGGWRLRRADSALAGNITAAVQAAVEEYRLWQRSAPGRDINPTRLIALVERAGAKRVDLAEPEFTPLKGWQIARETEIEFVFMGIEDE
ncbi:baseplate J/gp47 family protein [uncultured Desulfovibrio sp.]|uniref:baseplate assembly protein n=1 Tax=uncultured Desulfovibrio sp. TaxID=167968 RepID=UPI002615146D|nr:baseplate J/gp47 family protein [uncultured Desulfovibrio sp.]